MATKRLRGVSVYRPIIYGNTAVLLDASERGENDHTHRWTVGVRSATSPAVPSKNQASQIGGADDLSYFIKKVTFKLHETYSQPLRTIEKPPFEVTETGWGEFDIIIKIFFVPEAFEKPLTFTHHLKLHPWPLDLSSLPRPPTPVLNADGTEETPSVAPEPPALVLSPVHSWQYEEVVFVEPTELFYSTLLARPPAPLPKSNRHPRTLVHALGGGGNFGEFSLEMENDEGGRMDEARKKTLEEIEEMRKVLVGHEKELQGLKKEVEEIQATQAANATPAA
ncbi:yeats family protein [Leucosporidium creatinivorum]|uniref:Protein AF-9 homolog n=1 Tax=Leucosporidium creatinivorum TaxID=106004 RepID=A0A1Y2FN49_9BASI|nr:yeats family protein [Leucosporidium creatinivorum]